MERGAISRRPLVKSLSVGFIATNAYLIARRTMPAFFFPPFIVVPFSAENRHRSVKRSNDRFLFRIDSKENLSSEIRAESSSSSKSRNSREIEEKKRKKKKDRTRNIRAISSYDTFKRRVVLDFSQHKARIRSINLTLSLLVIINSCKRGCPLSLEQKSAISVKLRRFSRPV